MEIIYRSLQPTPQRSSALFNLPHLRHPLFALLHLRPVVAQHTFEENQALRRWARGRRNVAEVGVAEGASALALREVMHPEGVLYLIDPFRLSRFPVVNSIRRLVRKTVSDCRNGRVVWVEEFSVQAARSWTTPLDFLFLDGDHADAAVRQDWEKRCQLS